MAERQGAVQRARTDVAGLWGELWAPLESLWGRIQGDQPERTRLAKADWVLAGLAGAAAVLLAAWGFAKLGASLYTEGSLNIWYQADNIRVLDNLFNPTSNQFRQNVHPTFGILLTPWASLLPAMGLPPQAVAETLVLACAGLSAGVVFLALRFAGLSRGPAALFTGLFVVSAGFLHWYSAIETYPFAGLTICLSLLALAYGPTRRRAWWVAMCVLTCGVTITNFSAGLAATAARWPLRRAIEISAAATVAVLLLNVAQHALYPSAGYIFHLSSEKSFLSYKVEGWKPVDSLRSVVVYTMVTPKPVVAIQDGDRVVDNQHQPPTSAGALGVIAMSAWLALLALGCWGAVQPGVRPIALGLALMLLAQIAIGMLYGDETFLYASHILPMLVMVAALSWRTRARAFAAALAGVVLIFGFASNLATFSEAARLAGSIVDHGGNRAPVGFSVDGFILPRPH